MHHALRENCTSQDWMVQSLDQAASCRTQGRFLLSRFAYSSLTWGDCAHSSFDVCSSTVVALQNAVLLRRSIIQESVHNLDLTYISLAQRTLNLIEAILSQACSMYACLMLYAWTVSSQDWMVPSAKQRLITFCKCRHVHGSKVGKCCSGVSVVHNGTLYGQKYLLWTNTEPCRFAPTLYIFSIQWLSDFYSGMMRWIVFYDYWGVYESPSLYSPPIFTTELTLCIIVLLPSTGRSQDHLRLYFWDRVNRLCLWRDTLPSNASPIPCPTHCTVEGTCTRNDF